MEDVEKKSAGKMAVSAVILSKPGIITSVAFTGVAGMVVAARSLPPAKTVFLCALSLLLSAAGGGDPEQPAPTRRSTARCPA